MPRSVNTKKDSKWKYNPAYDMLDRYGWEYMDIFELQGYLVLRNGKDVQMGAIVSEGDKLSEVLKVLAERCAEAGNGKSMGGPIRVAEKARLNNGDLMRILHREHNKMDIQKARQSGASTPQE